MMICEQLLSFVPFPRNLCALCGGVRPAWVTLHAQKVFLWRDFSGEGGQFY